MIFVLLCIENASILCAMPRMCYTVFLWSVICFHAVHILAVVVLVVVECMSMCMCAFECNVCECARGVCVLCKLKFAVFVQHD